MKRAPRKRYRAPWVIFWVALGLRVACIVIGHTYRVPLADDHFKFGFEMGRIARSLALAHGFADPFNGHSGPTAWVPPLYPLLMAGAFKVFGIYTNAAALFLLVCNSIFSAAIAPAVYEIAARCFDAHRIARRGAKAAQPVAMWSAWLWAVYPAALQYAIHWIWEMSLSTCLFTWTIVFALRLRAQAVGLRAETPVIAIARVNRGEARVGSKADRRRRELRTQSPVLWVAFGALWGFVALSNASLLVCFPAMLVWVLWPWLWTPKTLLKPAAGAVLACLALAAVMSPWIERNARVMHAFVPTRTNFGAELYESTLPSHDAMPWGTSIPLWAGDPQFKRFAAMGEVAYSHERGAMAMARIRANPGQFWRYTLDRFLFFWDDTPQPVDKHPLQAYLRDLSYAFLSLCGLLGLGLALKRRVPGAGLMAIAFLLVPLPYYLVTVQARFRHPLEPLIAVLAVYLFRSTEAKKAKV